MDRGNQLAFYALWVGHPVLQLAVAAVMARRDRYKQFRFFFGYLLAQVISFAIVFPVYLTCSYQTFFYAYSTTAMIGLALGFLVIYEVFVDAFRPYHTLKDLGAVLFKWLGLVMLLLAAVVAASGSHSSHGLLADSVLLVERCLLVVQCGLVLFLVIFSRYLGITWKQRSYGIALGFGGYAAIELLVAAVSAGASVPAAQHSASLVLMTAYNATILTWLAYMNAKQKGLPVPSASQMATQRWEESLKDLRQPATNDSLIPMFESMVDRALSSRAPGDGDDGS
jgi:hypothetical protein